MELEIGAKLKLEIADAMLDGALRTARDLTKAVEATTADFAAFTGELEERIARTDGGVVTSKDGQKLQAEKELKL